MSVGSSSRCCGELSHIAIQGLHHGGDGFVVGRPLDCWERFDGKF